jgi:hypothetical protein
MRFLVAAILLMIAMIPQPAFAWGAAGHSIIAELAQRHLSPQALAALKQLMAGKGRPESGEVALASLASWADGYKNTPEGKFTYIWHYINLDIRQKDYDSTACEDRGVKECLVTAIPFEIAILKDKSKSKAERRQALFLLVHLVGDLVQPLHVAKRGDNLGGNLLTVHLKAKRPHDGPVLNQLTNLHALWDETLIDLHVYDWGSYADEIDARPLPDVEPGPYDAARIIAWANDTHCQGIEAYRLLDATLPKADDCAALTDPKVPGVNDPASPIDLNNAYTDPATEILTQQLAKGGARLHAILEDALAN